MGDEHVPTDYYLVDDRNTGATPIDEKSLKKKRSKKDQPRVDLCKLTYEEAADYLKGCFNNVYSNISKLEMEKYSSFGSYFDSSINGQDFSSAVTNLSEFKSLCKEKLCHILVITSSAIRATELIKNSPDVRRHCKVGKLFAKHIKIQEQLELLKTKKVPIAIGTPARILSLINAENYLFSRVKYVLIDVSRDSKLRSIFDIPETRKPLLETLFQSELFDQIRSGKSKIAFVN